MSPKDNEPQAGPISSPNGITLRPQPLRAARLHQPPRGLAIGAVLVLLLGAIAYGGYRLRRLRV